MSITIITFSEIGILPVLCGSTHPHNPTDAGAQHYLERLFNCIFSNGKISRISLTRWNFSSTLIQTVVSFISLSGLHMLDLSDTKISNIGLAILCDALVETPNLIELLNVYGNCISNLDCLKKLSGSKLKKLNLENNNLDIGHVEDFSRRLFISNFKLHDVRLERGLKSATDQDLSNYFRHKHGDDVIFQHMNETSTASFCNIRTNITKMCERNLSLQWKKVHSVLTDIVIGMDALHLPVYVLLFIVDCFSGWEEGVNRFKKVQLISKLQASIRNAKHNFRNKLLKHCLRSSIK